MIVIRHLDSTGNECDQRIYCEIACFSVDWTNRTLKIESSYEALNQIAESNQFNVYENEHIIPNSHWPTIEDFLSEDYQEYCYNCGQQL